MQLVLDGGYVKFSQEGEFEKHLVVEPEDVLNDKITISVENAFLMLKKLPANLKWNPYTESFVEVAV